MSYVYEMTENWVENGVRHQLFTVGHYKPTGEFVPESDHEDRKRAADRVAYLNGANVSFEE